VRLQRTNPPFRYHFHGQNRPKFGKFNGKSHLGAVYFTKKLPLFGSEQAERCVPAGAFKGSKYIVENVIANSVPHAKSGRKREIFMSLMILCACSAQTCLSVIISMGKIDRNFGKFNGRRYIGGRLFH